MKAKKFVSKVLGFFGIKMVAKIEKVAKKLDGTHIVNSLEEAVSEQDENEIKIPNDPESARRPWTFEVVWDIISDVDHICTIDGNKNVLIGPYRPHRVLTNEIHEAEFPIGSPPAMAVEAIRAQGITVITGRCKVPEQPPGILIDIESARNKVGNDYIRLFKKEHKIHVPDDDLVTNDVVVFGYIVAEFLAQFEALRSSSPISPVASTADSLERQNDCPSSVNPAQTLADPQSSSDFDEPSVGNVSLISDSMNIEQADPQSFSASASSKNNEQPAENVSVFPDPIDINKTDPQSLAPASSDNNDQSGENPGENVSVIPDPVDINKTDPQSLAPVSSGNNEQPAENVSVIPDPIDPSEDDSHSKATTSKVEDAQSSASGTMTNDDILKYNDEYNNEQPAENVSVIPDPIEINKTDPQSFAPASSDNNEQPGENPGKNESGIPDPVDINKTDSQSLAPASSDNNEPPAENESGIPDLIDLSEDDSKVSPATFPFDPWVGGQSSAYGSIPELSPAEISRTCAQFHDWKCGVGLMLVHKRCIPVTKIFTLNISLLQGNFDSHDQANKEALRRGIHHRFSVEHAAAQSADIFSPVSEPLAEKAHIVHQRQPDFVIVRHGA